MVNHSITITENSHRLVGAKSRDRFSATENQLKCYSNKQKRVDIMVKIFSCRKVLGSLSFNDVFHLIYFTRYFSEREIIS